MSNKISKYHLIIITIYLFVYIYFFFFTSSPFYNYIFNIQDFKLILPITLFASVTLLIVNNILKFGKIGINRKNLLKLPLIIIYALLLIAIPEEIIFRGYLICLYFINVKIILPKTAVRRI